MAIGWFCSSGAAVHGEVRSNSSPFRNTSRSPRLFHTKGVMEGSPRSTNLRCHDLIRRRRGGNMQAQRSDVGAGWVLFAGIMMIVGGLFGFFEGLGALLKSGRFYANVSTNYPYGTSVTTWGWIHLIVGAIVLLAGFYVLRGAVWARIVGITLASLSALANFFFIPFYPFWALLIITLDIFVIWALAAHGRALAEGVSTPEAPARYDIPEHPMR